MTRFACALVLLGGCGLYFGNNGGPGGDDDVCNGPAGGTSQQERNPQTGQCETITSGSCGCGPCAPTVAPPDWGRCDTQCLGQGEAACMATAGCQVEYLDKGTLDYWGCFAVAPSGPVETACDGLDAYSCSRHDNCIEVYSAAANGTTAFESCIAEPARPPPPPPPAACDTLTTEADCLARTDCDAIYNGYNCTCDPSGCTCQTEVFARCQAR